MLEKPEPFVGLNVYVGREKALIPHRRRNIYYSHFAAEPVKIVTVELEPLAVAIDQVRLAVDAEPLTPGTDEDNTRLLDIAKNVPLKAAGIRTWKAFANAYVCYMVSWKDDEVFIRPSRLDRAGRYEFHRDFGGYRGPAIPATEIARIIIEDYKGRSDG